MTPRELYQESTGNDHQRVGFGWHSGLTEEYVLWLEEMAQETIGRRERELSRQVAEFDGDFKE